MLIRVKAFGLNRAELFTRQGGSPSVTFPRVFGLEAVGFVAIHRHMEANRKVVVVTE